MRTTLSERRARIRSEHLAFLLLVLALLGLHPPFGPASASQQPSPPIVEIRPVGEPVTVFRYTTDACDKDDIPDAPARAFRHDDGTVTLLAPHWRNRRLRGPDLLNLRPDCAVVFEGNGDERPERFDDRLWITSTWTADGVTVFALVHSEYQGYRHPGRCSTGRYVDCWYNVISQAVSRDGGRSFRFERDAPPLVAAVPYRFERDARRHVGFFNPTNIVRHGEAWYAMVSTGGVGAQAYGNCLLRTTRLDEPKSWRAWDGTGFGVAFADPYAEDLRPESHVCEPIGRGALNWPVSSLTRHGPSGAFIALTKTYQRDGPNATKRAVLLGSASWDLINWSRPAVIRGIPTPHDTNCENDPPVSYPSLLDPKSPDRNFETVGDTAMLFVTWYNARGCRRGMDRDLLRLPVSIEVKRQ